VAQAALWGLGRVAGVEFPALRCTLVDLDSTATVGDGVTALWRELTLPDGETQTAYRRTLRHVPRLEKHTLSARAAGVGHGGNLPMVLGIGQRGLLDNLELLPATPRSPAPGEVQIRVRAAGLNFRDVLNALGMYPGDAGPLGSECAGDIVAVGEGVTAFKPGDAVVGIAAACFGHLATTRVELVTLKPAQLSYEEAATIPVAFLTAWYALHVVGGLKAGERVLIHAAAGGVGLAALQLVELAGAIPYGSAGSEKKRAFLKKSGIPIPVSSRSLDFVDQLREQLHGGGVDVVLNALAGDFIPASLSVLAEGGRFLELGKSDSWDAVQVALERPDVDYTRYDLAEDLIARPEEVGAALQRLVQHFEFGRLKPLPITSFPLSDAVGAFRFMAQAQHIGKVVLVPDTPLEGGGALFRADSTYLVTGGMGGVGLEVAGWLVDRGVRELVLVGRNSPSQDAKDAIDRLERHGARVHVQLADVSRPDHMARLLGDLEQDLPPIRGIFHAAGVLDDGVMLEQRWSRFEKVFAPKVLGTWNLHSLTRHLPLDHFVLFSSFAAVLGAPGQSNYAAANAFEDSLALLRRAEGLPASSINWGVWGGAGMAARLSNADRERLKAQGLEEIPPALGLEALEAVLLDAIPQVGVIQADWGKLLDGFPPGLEPPMLQTFAQESRQGQDRRTQLTDLQRRLDKAPAAEKLELLTRELQGLTARVLGLAPNRAPDPRQPLNEIGLDSLMAVELRNSLSAALGRNLPSTLLFNYPTLDALAGHLAREVLKLDLSQPDVQSAPGPQTAPAGDELATELESMSEEELAAFLAAELGGGRS
jgi:NADPH:quinone reductase-like Zn-dependent oxidoreductase/acyl carrier protein